MFAAKQKVDFTKSLLCWRSRNVYFSLSRPVKQEAQGEERGDTSFGTKEGRKLSDAGPQDKSEMCVSVYGMKVCRYKLKACVEVCACTEPIHLCSCAVACVARSDLSLQEKKAFERFFFLLL